MTTSAINIFDSDALECWRKQHGFDPERIRKLRIALCKRFLADDVVQEIIPSAKEQLQIHWLEINQRCDSQIDGATKLLMRTGDGLLLETVILRISTGRTTLCVSSQVGCAAACDFCATGKMGVAKNLSAAQILDQVVQAGQILTTENRQLRNIVFMGMGEPFHNEAELFSSIKTLIAPDVFYHPPTRILVSSVGVADGMIRCAQEFPNINLALSLHSIEQSVRSQLIPLAKKYPLDELRSALKEINRIQSCPVMIEYLMLADLNDALSQARDLAAWLNGLNVHVNLIPYNPISAAPHLVGSDRKTIDAFSAELKSAGMKTTTRYSLGKDIAAACGQLVQQENRRIAQELSLQQIQLP